MFEKDTECPHLKAIGMLMFRSTRSVRSCTQLKCSLPISKKYHMCLTYGGKKWSNWVVQARAIRVECQKVVRRKRLPHSPWMRNCFLPNSTFWTTTSTCFRIFKISDVALFSLFWELFFQIEQMMLLIAHSFCFVSPRQLKQLSYDFVYRGSVWTNWRFDQKEAVKILILISQNFYFYWMKVK